MLYVLFMINKTLILIDTVFDTDFGIVVTLLIDNNSFASSCYIIDCSNQIKVCKK